MKSYQAVTQNSHAFLSKENVIFFIFAVITLVIILLPIQYGYFRDELYYIALSKNLAWGYVDVPPLMPLCIAVMRELFGSSMTAFHLIIVVFAVFELFIAKLMVKKLGGDVSTFFRTKSYAAF